MVIEAMKMEYTLNAPFEGTLTSYCFGEGELVSHGDMLAIVEEVNNGELPKHVKIVEVGHEMAYKMKPESPPAKVDLVNALAAAGLKHIEAGAFVSPKWVHKWPIQAILCRFQTSAWSGNKCPHPQLKRGRYGTVASGG